MLEEFGNALNESPLVSEFDLDDQSQSETVFKKLQEHEGSKEWLLYYSAAFLSMTKDAIEHGNASFAAWTMANAERFRSLYVFKEHFEEVVWMGHSARRLIDLLNIWDNNKHNADEAFWQTQFQSHSLALSQLFSVPVTFVQEKAYVGGQGIDRHDARLVDFLFSGGSANEAILVEIKTPVTPLMQKRAYRGNAYAPDAQLSGSIVQVADYRHSLTRDLEVLVRDRHFDLSAFNPKSVIIAGNSASLETGERRRSFELFRTNLANVEIVTFDEVFRKVEGLASLFNLVREAKP